MKTGHFFAVTLASCISTTAAEPVYDVVVYGGSSAGVIAAVQSARMGRTVVLIEPGTHLGGLTSGGLGMTDSGNKEVIGGLAREFYQRVKRHYANDAAWKWEKRGDYKWFAESADALWRFEPHVAEKVFTEMLAAAKVPVLKGERLDLDGGVKRESKGGVMWITEIRMESGRIFRGKRFIDATYEGDFMARAGVRYHVGREANAAYGETLNGVQTKRATKHQFSADVDPYVVPGDRSSGLLFGVHGGSPGVDGEGDQRVQAYNFRLALTDVPENRVPFPRPDGYDPQRYELLRRYIDKGFDGMLQLVHLMPNRKTDTNNDGAFSSDFIGANYGYPDGDYATRDRIIEEHENYQKGWLYFLSNDPRVPEAIRQKYGRWGLARDEFTDNGNWPHQIYVREARRMVSDWVHTEHDCRRTRETPQPVGMGSYNMDSHNVQRYVDERGFARNEGDIQVSPGGPYPISYLSIRPRKDESANLLVPVCCSSSHIAYGSVRMEPVFMILGQSAATAACLSIDDKIAVQDIPYGKLRERLLKDGQVLEFARQPAPKGETSGGRDPRQLAGVIIDDDAASFSGSWTESSSVGGYVGRGYRHHNSGVGAARFTYRATADGECEVNLSWTPHANRARSVKVVVTATSLRPATELTVDQTGQPGPTGFRHLATLTLRKDDVVTIELHAGTSGYVIADAVQFLVK
jgi:hypothetical protein